ncbi:MAG: SDR family NAD(P)-dependent oxidoreductase [Pseudomonadota bacterium]
MTTRKKALILGATGGIGAAVSARLSDAGRAITGLSRRDGLDWTAPAQAEAALLRAADAGPFDLIFDATGALTIGEAQPEKKLAAIEAEAMLAQFAVNAVGPALILKHHTRLLPRQGRSVFATLSARVGSIGDNRLGGWISYRAAKAALNQVVRTAAVEIARTRPEAICAALHPGTVRTTLSTPVIGQGGPSVLAPEDAAARLLSVLDGLTPAKSGGFYAYDGQPIPW